MAKQWESEKCPFCGRPALVAYVRQENGMGDLVQKYRDEVRCTNPECPGEKS
jgi:hypothetical protein